MVRSHSEHGRGLQFYIIKQYNNIINQNLNDSGSVLLLWNSKWTLPIVWKYNTYNIDSFLQITDI